ncbi:MAG: polysaccharide deacetylase family protein, partial [Acidobacteriales bacterium]|nr:polysaccharide deacetylase family protein [Terriglobales bacterium]
INAPVGYAAGSALALATYAGYASMAPRSQFFGRTFTHGNDSHKLALTFDDGPNEPYTAHLLDVLAQENVKATFFVIGRYATQRPDILRNIAEEGHVIGNHTYSHPNLIFCSASRIEQEIEDCAMAIRDAVGAHSNLFRPPFGGRRPDVLRIVRRKGLIPIMWSVTSYDWSKSATVEKIQGRVDRQIKRPERNVILLHDGGHQAFGADRRHTVAATKAIIRAYKGNGYEFATIPEILQRQL